MPKFICSYAYDITCFTDFTVEAKSERAALRKIQRAFKAGRFTNVDTRPCWENGLVNERVFVQSEATEPPVVTMEDLVGREHRFDPHTHLCQHCGVHLIADAVENSPCIP